VKDAASTWAVVIGIDAYDNFAKLKGAAADSVATVKWLRRLGVPDHQIMLHAAPDKASEKAIDDLGLPVGGCTEPKIWKSFERLGENRGARLYVFLSGHGLYEPSGHRVFLTQEAGQKTVSNLGIAWYARWLRGLDYNLQLLVMDGCLNVAYDANRRALFKEGEHSSVEPGPPRNVLQVLCCGAEKGQRALEVKGRGLFTSKLLAALDPDEPDTRCVDIDEKTGTKQFDIFRAVQVVAGPATANAANESGNKQNPSVEYVSEWSTPAVFPAVDIPTPEPTQLSVSVKPGVALTDVKWVTLTADDTEWSRKLPPAEFKSTPYVSVLPPNLTVWARCQVKPQTNWIEPGQRNLITAGEQDIIFDLTPPAEGKASPPAIQTIDVDGNVVKAIPMRRVDPARAVARLHRAFEIREGALGKPDWTIGRSHLDGDSVSGGLAEGIDEALIFELPEGNETWGSRDAEKAFELAELVTESTPEGIHAVVREQNVLQEATSLVIPLTHTGAVRLAGFWAGEPVIKVGDMAISPNSLVARPLVPVDGPTTIRIELPWGSWSERIDALRGQATRVELPVKVGVPPLRARLLRDEMGAQDEPLSVVAERADLSGASIVGPEGEPLGTRLEHRPRTEFSAWNGSTFTPSAKVARGRRWGRYVSRNGLRFPLSEVGAVAVYLGRTERAEPLSRTPSKLWDRLVAFGDLDEVDESGAENLASRKWNDLLLGLAGAYACYANGQEDYLAGTLKNLRGLDSDLPDVAILEAALDARSGIHRREVSSRLSDAGIPVFRWGVAIGQLAAEHYSEPELGRRLETVEKGLVPSSTWTLWYEGL
jgi:hypothetical protein